MSKWKSPTNRERCRWARKAALVFAEETGLKEVENGMDTIISHLLDDLHHLADYEGLSWDELMRKADFHYDAEVSWEEP